MKSLAVSNVVVSYGALRAVDSVELTVEAGEVCGLVGPNGSGKSTLLNAISGFVGLTEGSIAIGEQDVSRKPPHAVARLGVARTFQLVRLLPSLTVEDNVASGYRAESRGDLASLLRSTLLPRRLRGEAQDDVVEAMKRAGIDHLADVMVDELPFGTQRRVEVARAIVSKPRLLLLDEPAAGLDESDLAQLAEIIKRESERDCAVLLVDHHLRFVLSLCPRVVVLNFGHKIFDGSSRSAVEDPAVKEAYVGG